MGHEGTQKSINKVQRADNKDVNYTVHTKQKRSENGGKKHSQGKLKEDVVVGFLRWHSDRQTDGRRRGTEQIGESGITLSSTSSVQPLGLGGRHCFHLGAQGLLRRSACPSSALPPAYDFNATRTPRHLILMLFRLLYYRYIEAALVFCLSRFYSALDCLLYCKNKRLSQFAPSWRPSMPVCVVVSSG